MSSYIELTKNGRKETVLVKAFAAAVGIENCTILALDRLSETREITDDQLPDPQRVMIGVSYEQFQMDLLRSANATSIAEKFPSYEPIAG